jgi:hypothetical protein
MSQEPSTTGRPISGDDIISEIIRNSEAGQFKIRQTALLPSVYHVYLNTADYDTIRPVIPAVTAEARAALIEKLEELNRRSKPSAITRALGFDSAKPIEYKILDPDWTIEFHPDAEDKLAPGDLEIYSELASAPQPDFEGAPTRHVTRRRSTAAGPVYSSEEAPTASMPRSQSQAFARIRYQDASGQQTFEMTKDQVVIGRGGKAFWVDLKLNAPPDVSREHCRIRRDAVTGHFFLKDVSQFGTSIDGVRSPSSLEIQGGQERDTNVETQLPPRATITLADVFILEFEASG